MTKQTKYILIPKANPSISILFKYGFNQLLTEFKIEGEPTETQHQWILERMPVNEKFIEQYKKTDKFIITEVPMDLSFEAFWDAYDLKIDKKKQCQNLWHSMKDEERIKALLYIDVYNKQLKKTQVQKAYPTTYLNQEYYNVWQS